MEWHIPSLIERKRDGGDLSAGEIAHLVRGLTDGSIPEYQWSALAMAVYFRGMTAAETWQLTQSMRDSGRVLTYRSGHPLIVDKHSTGGVGDKVSLILAPLLACSGVWVPMISGRGLGITGGTLDKLESIPGFNTQLPEQTLLEILDRTGVFMAGQTAELCPADKKLYALRDVTATVPSQPLIVASIMSKKLAESLDRLVLDVKFGTGAFMKSRTEAAALAAAMEEVGRLSGVAVSAVLNPMDEPLGRTAGNALEVRECVEVLCGGGPEDLVSLTLDLAEKVAPAPRHQLAHWLKDGAAWRKFQELTAAQGGNPDDLENIGSSIHRAPVIHEVGAPCSGMVRKFDALTVGRAIVRLGGGRACATDAVDYAVGFDEMKKCGESVTAGEPLCRIHARSRESALEASAAVLSGCQIV